MGCWQACFANWGANRKRKSPRRRPTGSPTFSNNTSKRVSMIISRRAFLWRSAAFLPFSLSYPFPRLARAQPPLLGHASAGSIRFEVAPASSGLDFVLRNGAQGRKYQVETLLGGLGVIDFDGDGWPDLFCVNGAALPSLAKTGQEYWNRLFRNNRDGTFSDVTEKAGLAGQGYGMGVAVGDYNNDGHEDLFVVGVHGNRLYRNNGDGTFTDRSEERRVGKECRSRCAENRYKQKTAYEMDG